MFSSHHTPDERCLGLSQKKVNRLAMLMNYTKLLSQQVATAEHCY